MVFIGVTLVSKIYIGYRFQVHKSTTHHLYTVLCVHTPSQASFYRCLCPCTLPDLPLPPYCGLCLCFYFPTPFTLFTQPCDKPPRWQLSIFSLYLWVCFYFVCWFILFVINMFLYFNARQSVNEGGCLQWMKFTLILGFLCQDGVIRPRLTGNPRFPNSFMRFILRMVSEGGL